MAVVSLTSIVSLVSSVYLSDTYESETRLIAQALNASNIALRVDSAESEEQRLSALTQLSEHWAYLEPLQRNAMMDSQIRESVYLINEHVRRIVENGRDRESFHVDRFNSEVIGLHQQLANLHQLLQKRAEKSASLLRLIQSLALFITVVVISFSLLIIRRDVEQPLLDLTRVAKAISEGDFAQTVGSRGRGELAVLAEAVSDMSTAIQVSQGNLEQRVSEKTSKLQRANEALTLLKDLTLYFAQIGDDTPNLDLFLQRIASAANVDRVDVCLVTEAGETPYEKYDHGERNSVSQHCATSICNKCTSAVNYKENEIVGTVYRSQFVIQTADATYGVMTASSSLVAEDWQLNMLRSISAHLANGLGLKRARERARRIALLKERAVIARELHDSLAQALTYLRIQVVRMDKALSTERTEQQQNILNELDQGLTSAYKELRELLTTFRLKIEGQTIEQALRETVAKLRERNENIEIAFDFGIAGIPLTPHEEIHLLQIAREAIQNAFYHSRGDRIEVSLGRRDSDQLVLRVHDNGSGIDTAIEKLNHYGLAIMRERSRDLNGEITVESEHNTGTTITLSFQPVALLNSDRVSAINL